MAKASREYIDKDREVMTEYYDLQEEYSGSGGKTLKRKLRRLIEKDADFLDSYLVLCEILEDEGNYTEAEGMLDKAYDRAMKLILDRNGEWPDILMWGFLENRHIIRTILNKAISFWMKEQTDEALEIFRNLLKTNPGDNVGARYFLLAIKMGMSFDEHEDRFNKGGYYDLDVNKWFNEHNPKFPQEFDEWRKEVEGLG